MANRQLDAAHLQKDEDWEGNNIAITCPACGQVYIVSGLIHRGMRVCPSPSCGKSTGYVIGGKKKGGSARIEW